MVDLYPLNLLADFELMPTGTGKGVMAVCRRHDGEVSVFVVNSVSGAPLLGDLAYMAAEHEAKHHGGPAMPDEGDPDTRSSVSEADR